MADVTYISAAHGFGVTYDDELLVHVDDPEDPRYAAAWSSRIPTTVAAGVLFLPRAASAEDVALGRAPSQFITTDDQPVPASALSGWDWDAVTFLRAAPFVECTGTTGLEATALYWRGFPVLQLAALPREDDEPAAGPGAPEPPVAGRAPVEVLGLLHTPAQTFASLLVMPMDDVGEWGDRFQALMDGFFLVPIEREGRARTGHRFVRSLHVEAGALRGDRPAPGAGRDAT